jgi:hypothetical protein
LRSELDGRPPLTPRDLILSRPRRTSKLNIEIKSNSER